MSQEMHLLVNVAVAVAVALVGGLLAHSLDGHGRDQPNPGRDPRIDMATRCVGTLETAWEDA
jgi:hypothetical protein